MADAKAFSILLDAGKIQTYDVVRFETHSRVGRAAEATVVAYFAEQVDPDEILGAPARLQYGRDEAEQTFDGMVMSLTMVASRADVSDRGVSYRLQLTSLLAPLQHSVNCRIFQELDVQAIITQVLTDHNIDAARQSWRLAASYPKREYCVQYNESALSFVSRLCEEEGIHFYSTSSEDGEMLVFADDSTASDPIDGDSTVPYRHGSGLERAFDAAGAIEQRHCVASGKVVLRDYNFKVPSLDMTVSAEADVDADLEIYDYPGLYVEPAEGTRLAQVRLEALQARRRTYEIEADCPRVSAGRWLELSDTGTDLDGKYFVVGVSQAIDEDVLKTKAWLVPKEVPYRLPQDTPLPLIDGPQTARVMAPAGAQPEEIHTDEHGRCKVLFHWDRYGEPDDTASCWMRVSQQQTSGSMILPRVGWEVIVEFLEGNPDRPIITGRVYNGRFMPPYTLPEGKTRTALRTASTPGGGGSNEIRFEDKTGSEEVSIQSQKDTSVATANNKTRSVGSNDTMKVTVNSTLDVGANQTFKITNGFKNNVDGSQSISVGGNRKLEVDAVYGLTSGGASATSVGGNQFEMDGNPIKALISLAVKAATDAAKAQAKKAMAQLDQAVSAKVNQVMGPINDLQAKVQNVGNGLNAVSNGNLGAAAGALGSAAGLPTPAGFGASLAGGSGGGGGGGIGLSNASAASGLDTLVNGAINAGSGALGDALGVGGAGGGGKSAANKAGADGAGSGNSAADSATGPGHAIFMCNAAHTEDVGSLKATIAAAGINTTVKGARTQSVGAARVELVAGTRAETCLAGKTEKAVGLLVLSSAPESETVGGSRTTMVGGAILQKLDAGYAITAGGKAMFVGAFHKIDASTSISLKCGGSEVVIDGSGVTIKAAAVTITAPNVTITKATAEN